MRRETVFAEALTGSPSGEAREVPVPQAALGVSGASTTPCLGLPAVAPDSRTRGLRLGEGFR